MTCQYRWSHTTSLKELWRVVSTNDPTLHVSKICNVSWVSMVSHNTSERVVTCYLYWWSHTTHLKRVVTCYLYSWSHTTRPKELWRVICTHDLTRHVRKSCDVLSVPIISHGTSKRGVSRCQYRWFHTTRLNELWLVVNTDDLTPHVWKSCDVMSVPMISFGRWVAKRQQEPQTSRPYRSYCRRCSGSLTPEPSCSSCRLSPGSGGSGQ